MVLTIETRLTLTRPIGLPPSRARFAENCGSALNHRWFGKNRYFFIKNDVIKSWLVLINIVFFSSISFVWISYKSIWLKKWSWPKTHRKMRSWRAEIVFFSKRCASKIWAGLKKIDSFTLETSKNHLIRNFLRNGRLRVKANLIQILSLNYFIFWISLLY